MIADGVVFVEVFDGFEGDAGEDGEGASGFINLDDFARTHVEFGLEAAEVPSAEACPAVEGEGVEVSVAVFGLEEDFLVVAVTGSVGLAVYVGKGLGVGEVAGVAEGEEEGDWGLVDRLIGWLVSLLIC